jgi:hypothetical protein
MKTKLGLDGELCWIPANDLTIDDRYQRAIHPGHLARMMAHFNPDGLGTLQISLRGDGKDYVLDGQHRVITVKQKGLGHLPLECIRRRGLSLEREEEIFTCSDRPGVAN